MTWAAYQPATYIARGPQPGAEALMDVFVADFKARNYGIYNPRSIRGGGGLSLHAEGRAVDLGYSNKALGDEALEALLRHREALGIQLIIWWRRIYSAKNPVGAAYTGVSPHTDHIHVELSRPAAATLTVPYIRSVLRGGAALPPAPSPLEDIMATKAELQQVVDAEGHETRTWTREELARNTQALAKEIREQTNLQNQWIREELSRQTQALTKELRAGFDRVVEALNQPVS